METKVRLDEINRVAITIVLAMIWAFNASFVYNGVNHFLIDVLIFFFLFNFYELTKVGFTDGLIWLAVFCFLVFQNGEVAGACMTASVVWMEFFVGKNLGKALFVLEVKRVPLCVFLVSLILGIKGFLTYSWLFSNDYVGIFPMWGTGMMLPRTQHEYFLIMMVTSLAFWVIYIQYSRVAVVGMVFALATLALCLYGIGRVGTCSMIVVFLLVGMMYIWENRSSVNFRKLIKYSGSTLVILGLLFLDEGRVYNLITKRDWSSDGGIFRNVRFYNWKSAIELMIQYPMDSYKFHIIPYEGRTENLAHNTWIDAGRYGSVFSMFFLVCFTLLVFVCLIQLWRRDKSVEKYSLIAVFMGMTLYCMFEPVLNANPYFFCGEVFLSGMVVGGYYART